MINMNSDSLEHLESPAEVKTDQGPSKEFNTSLYLYDPRAHNDTNVARGTYAQGLKHSFRREKNHKARAKAVVMCFQRPCKFRNINGVPNH